MFLPPPLLPPPLPHTMSYMAMEEQQRARPPLLIPAAGGGGWPAIRPHASTHTSTREWRQLARHRRGSLRKLLARQAARRCCMHARCAALPCKTSFRWHMLAPGPARPTPEHCCWQMARGGAWGAPAFIAVPSNPPSQQRLVPSVEWAFHRSAQRLGRRRWPATGLVRLLADDQMHLHRPLVRCCARGRAWRRRRPAVIGDRGRLLAGEA